MKQIEGLLGYWSLHSWTKVWPSGRSCPVVAEGVGGFIHYGEDGVMAVTIYERKSHTLLTSYTGPFEYLDGKVIHYPVTGFSPKGINEKKVRYLSLDQGDLRMRTKPMIEAQEDYFDELLWHRLMS